MAFEATVVPGSPARVEAGLLALDVSKGGDGPVLGGAAAAIDAACGGTLSAFAARSGFEGRVAETLALPAPGGVAAESILLVGVGDARTRDLDVMRRAAAAVVKRCAKVERAATTLLDAAPEGADRAAASQAIAEGAALGTYVYTRFKADPKPSALEHLTLVGRAGARVTRGVEDGLAIAAAVAWARDRVNTPAGALTPVQLAEEAVALARSAGLKCKVLDEAAIAKQGMGGLAGVGQGSENPPRFLELTYAPAGARSTVALVGKGVTFDSGGLSLKSPDGMETMKTDMSGAAAVIAAMSVLPRLGVKTKVIGLTPLVENMPSGRAIRPGDVLRIRNGKTVEVLNTDAEGRLILADALSIAVERKVDAILDLATLTGACMVALGAKYAGLMGSHEDWVDQVCAAAGRAGESVWPLPLPDEYRRELDSEVADLKNVAGTRYGGTLTAGLFLREFAGGLPWAHLDIAGPARAGDSSELTPKGGTGFGVRTIVELLRGFKKVG